MDVTPVRNADDGITIGPADASDADGGVVTGFLQFRADRREGDVLSLYVHPSAWSQGVGSALLAFAETSLVGSGVEVARLWTAKESQQSRRFYERRGWVASGREQTQHLGPASVALHEVEYQKLLPQRFRQVCMIGSERRPASELLGRARALHERVSKAGPMEASDSEIDDVVLERIRSICQQFVGADEAELQDRPLFRVGRRRFAIFNGRTSPPRPRWSAFGRSLHFLADPLEIDALRYEGKCRRSPHHGDRGWMAISLDDLATVDWDEIAELLESGYRQVSSKLTR